MLSKREQQRLSSKLNISPECMSMIDSAVGNLKKGKCGAVISTQKKRLEKPEHAFVNDLINTDWYKDYEKMITAGAIFCLYREKCGYSQKRLAEKVKVSVELIDSVEKGDRTISKNLAGKAGKLFRVPPAMFLEHPIVHRAGQKSKGPCEKCRKLVKTTFRYAPLKYNGFKIPHILQDFCDICGSSIAIPHCSTYRLRAYCDLQGALTAEEKQIEADVLSGKYRSVPKSKWDKYLKAAKSIKTPHETDYKAR